MYELTYITRIKIFALEAGESHMFWALENKTFYNDSGATYVPPFSCSSAMKILEGSHMVRSDVWVQEDVVTSEGHLISLQIIFGISK